jgi:iron complex outermembrane receptor protein
LRDAADAEFCSIELNNGSHTTKIYRGRSLLQALACISGGAAAMLVAVPTQAAVLEEVVVTAQKREQNLQDVGILVTAFGGDQLDALGMTSSVDITQQVPAMQLQTFTPAFTIIDLRGISQNNFHDNLEAPVAVYVDGAYVPSMNAINGQLFDVDG